MRRFVVLIVLVVAGLGGAFFYANRGRIHSAEDAWNVVKEGLAGLTRDQDGAASLPPVSRSGDSIRIASFNVQVLGRTKMSKPHVLDLLCRIMRKFDIVAIQEIRSEDQSVLPVFVDLINATGRHYDYVIGPRLGRTHSKEQYAFIFDTASVEIDRNQLYTLSDPDDLFHREPLVGWFRVRGPAEEDAFTFTLVNLHTDPDEARFEVDLIPQVIELVRDDGRGEDDVIVLGDLNAGDDGMGEVARTAGLRWAISYLPTNTRGTEQYDNILFQEQATTEYTGRSGVTDFFSEYNLTMEEALEVSDHLPVWAEFTLVEGGLSGSLAGGTPETVERAALAPRPRAR